MNSIKLLAIVFGTFIIGFLTSLLLDMPVFQNPVRYVLVILLILIELYFGFLMYQFISTKKE